jgi:hypothetical protein
MSSARNYTQATLKKLFALSGNQCAFPDCTQNIIDKESNMIGEICHIEAAKQGGLRYNTVQTDKERAHYNNLILLCRNHHQVIDNPDNIDKYTVEALKEMKDNHENNYMYNPYKVSQTVIEKIMSDVIQQSAEQNYSQNVTTTNKNLGNGTQLVNIAREVKTDNIIGTQNINHYPSYDTSQLEQNRQDRDIIDEIFHHILENVPSKGTTLEQIRDSKPFSKLRFKVPLNFPKHQMKTFQEMLHQTWDKKSLVEHYLAEQSAIDETKVFDLQEYIQSEFRRLRGSDDHHIKIDDLQVIEQLSQQYITGNKRKNDPVYQANAKAIVLYFFEFCTIGQKTEQEQGETFDLFG